MNGEIKIIEGEQEVMKEEEGYILKSIDSLAKGIGIANMVLGGSLLANMELLGLVTLVIGICVYSLGDYSENM